MLGHLHPRAQVANPIKSERNGFQAWGANNWTTEAFKILISGFIFKGLNSERFECLQVLSLKCLKV